MRVDELQQVYPRYESSYDRVRISSLIKKLLGNVPLPVKLGLLKTTEPCAFSHAPDTLYVCSGLIEYIYRDRGVVAFVIAHELSHLTLGHLRARDVQSEIEADRNAVKLLQAAGIDKSAAVRAVRLFDGENVERIKQRLEDSAARGDTRPTKKTRGFPGRASVPTSRDGKPPTT